MRIKIPHNIFRWILTVLLIIALVSFMVGKSGLWYTYKVKKECEKLELQIVAESLAVDSLKEVDILLQNDKKYIERAVRNELGYSRPDEITIKFIDK